MLADVQWGDGQCIHLCCQASYILIDVGAQLDASQDSEIDRYDGSQRLSTTNLAFSPQPRNINGFRVRKPAYVDGGSGELLTAVVDVLFNMLGDAKSCCNQLSQT